MPTAILVVFEYTEDKMWGALVDLHRVYRMCCINNFDTYIITDIATSTTDNISIQRARHREWLHTYLLTNSARVHIVRSGRSLEIACASIPQIDQRLLLYYSGHGSQGNNLLLPNNEVYSFFKLQTQLEKKFTDTIWILDCCHPSGFHLNYQLIDDSLVAISTQARKHDTNILILAAGTSQQQVASSKNGSRFTKYLVKLLTENSTLELCKLKRSLDKLIHRHQNYHWQETTIYSSHPHIYAPIWLNTYFSSNDNNFYSCNPYDAIYS